MLLIIIFEYLGTLVDLSRDRKLEKSSLYISYNHRHLNILNIHSACTKSSSYKDFYNMYLDTVHNEKDFVLPSSASSLGHITCLD